MIVRKREIVVRPPTVSPKVSSTACENTLVVRAPVAPSHNDNKINLFSPHQADLYLSFLLPVAPVAPTPVTPRENLIFLDKKRDLSAKKTSPRQRVYRLDKKFTNR